MWAGAGVPRVITLPPSVRVAPPYRNERSVVTTPAQPVELTVGGLERRGRPWTPWRARANRAVHEQFLDALVVELGQVDPGASVSHAHGVVPEGTEAGPPAEGGAPVQRERREVRPRTHDPRADGL